MQRGDLFRDRKFYIFIGLLLVLVIVNVNQWRPSSNTSARTQGTKSDKQQSVQADPILFAERLTAEKTEFEQEKRNIFTFFHTQPSVPSPPDIQQQAPPPPEPICGNGACEAGEDLANCPGDCQPPPPPAPVITLRYI